MNAPHMTCQELTSKLLGTTTLLSLSAASCWLYRGNEVSEQCL